MPGEGSRVCIGGLRGARVPHRNKKGTECCAMTTRRLSKDGTEPLDGTKEGFQIKSGVQWDGRGRGVGGGGAQTQAALGGGGRQQTYKKAYDEGGGGNVSSF